MPAAMCSWRPIERAGSPAHSFIPTAGSRSSHDHHGRGEDRMSERQRLRMTDEEVRVHLDGCYRMQVATVDADGSPHLVPLAYMWFDGKLAFWTDPRSRKV